MYFKILIIFVFFIYSWNVVFAEEAVPTTYSEEAKNIIFDGKWTFTREWKESSLNSWRLNDGSEVVLRTAHDGNFLYVFVDNISDIFSDKNEDRVTICIGNKNHFRDPTENDYCFIVTLGDKSPVVLQGNSNIAVYGNFKKIPNRDFIGIGMMSDKADRYIAVPHTSYEFKIPLDLIGRESEYSFYLSAYDFHRNSIGTWPRDIKLDNSFRIPSPEKWGTLYSPDNSLPEFDMPFLVMLIVFSSVICITQIKKSFRFY